MADKETSIYGGPTKRFFVSMLTRDIELDDAILDLIDNCVDGAMRASPGKVGSPEPFKGYRADLTIEKNSFQIRDNCGGIPPDYIEDAFSLGRPSIEKDGDLPTIGMYGIGMKRAIFKIGKNATVTSIHKDARVSVDYSDSWLNPENNDWDLPLRDVLISAQKPGVTITCHKLKDDIKGHLTSDHFLNSLSEKVSEHFGYIMQKGFEIYINNQKLKPTTLPLLASRGKGGIQPFDYVAKIGDVHVKVTIGFFRPLVQEREIEEETDRPTGRERAGISVVCNDRIVLLHDRTLVTGWGEGGVPRYHPQFRAIAGLVVLMSNNAEHLPISTTKRGLDVGSEVYLKVRQACVEGIKVFTDFTNKWKGIEKDASEFFETAERKDAKTQVRLAADRGVAVRGMAGAKKFKPTLPTPETRSKRRRISFMKDLEEIDRVSIHLFKEKGQPPSVVGERCFDRILKESSDV